MVSPSEKGTSGYDERQQAPPLPQGGATISPQRGERHHEFDPAAGSLDELKMGRASVPGGAIRCRARTTDEVEISGPSTEMTAPAPVSLVSENTWLSKRAGTGRGWVAWPLTRHRFHSQQRISSRREGESWTDASPDWRRSPCENESSGSRNSMTRSISRVRTRVAFPTAPHECDEALEAGHETGRGLVGPHGPMPS